MKRKDILKFTNILLILSFITGTVLSNGNLSAETISVEDVLSIDSHMDETLFQTSFFLNTSFSIFFDSVDARDLSYVTKILLPLENFVQKIMGTKEIRICYDAKEKSLYLFLTDLRNDIKRVFNVSMQENKGIAFEQCEVTSEIKTKIRKLIFENSIPLNLAQERSFSNESKSKDIDLLQARVLVGEGSASLKLLQYTSFELETGGFVPIYERAEEFGHKVFSWELPDGIYRDIEKISFTSDNKVVYLVGQVEKNLTQKFHQKMYQIVIWDLAKFEYKMFSFKAYLAPKMVVLSDGRIVLSQGDKISIIDEENNKMAMGSLVVGDNKKSYITDLYYNEKEPSRLVACVYTGSGSTNIVEIDAKSMNVRKTIELNCPVFGIYYSDSDYIYLSLKENVGILSHENKKLYVPRQSYGFLFTGTAFGGAIRKNNSIFAVNKMTRGFLLQNFVCKNGVPQYVTVSVFGAILEKDTIGPVSVEDNDKVYFTHRSSIGSESMANKLMVVNPVALTQESILVNNHSKRVVFGDIKDIDICKDKALVVGKNGKSYFVDLNKQRIVDEYEQMGSVVAAGSLITGQFTKYFNPEFYQLICGKIKSKLSFV